MATQRKTNGADPERLHSVRRSLAVLEALAGRPAGATPKELSLGLGLHLSTCYRLLNTLVSAGYVARDADGLFRLGSRVAYLNNGYLAGLRPPPEALPFVHALQLATGETSMLSQLEGRDVVNTVVVAGTRQGAIPPGYVGLAAPANAVAAGRVLLAGLSASRLDAYLATRVAECGAPFPLTHPEALRAELERIRQAGYALDYGERHHGICCIAAPVVDPAGTIETSLAVVAPCERFRQEEPELVKVVLAVARTIGSLRIAGAEGGARGEAGFQDEEVVAQAAIAAAWAEVSEAMSRVG